MSDSATLTPPGTARCPGTSWDDLVAADARPMPDFMREDSYRYLGSEPLKAERYVGADFFKLEMEKMWPKVWQMAARDEEMLQPGDTVVYENAGRSYLLIRQDDGSVRAFHNVCLHRGRKLRTESGPSTAIVCPYHGFSWNRNGSLREIPCRWDFGHLADKEMNLPEAKVDRWGGYIFLREAPDGPSLMEYLSPLPQHFERWHHEECSTVAWVAKVVHANWKIVNEAFQEAWHAYTTHPQIAPFVSDVNSRYNIYGDHVNVGFNAQGAMSPLLDPEGKTEQWIVDSYLEFNGRAALKDGQETRVPPGQTARRVLGQRAREEYSELFNRDLDHATDAELLDSIFYSVFPNWGPWGGFMPSIDYRFRPWPDQNHTLMEVRILKRGLPGEPLQPAVPMKLLSDDEPWESAPELGQALGHVLDQDVTNQTQVHEGLKVSKTGLVNLGDYQEIRIRHFHDTIDKYINS